MKFRVTFKSPDVVEDAINEAIQDKYGKTYKELDKQYLNFKGDTDELIRLENLREEAYADIESMETAAKKHFKYGEYVTVEVDTETNTVKVV